MLLNNFEREILGRTMSPDEIAALEMREYLLISATATGFKKPINCLIQPTFSLEYTNGSGKDIDAFKCAVIFKDRFGDVVLVTQVKISTKTEAHSTYTCQYKSEKIFSDPDFPHAWEVADIKNFTATCIPQMIIFSDGTKIGGSSCL